MRPAEPEIESVGWIAVIGGTGSGKSTFINSIIGKDVAGVGHGLETQTTEVKEYNLSTTEGIQVALIDTPGLSDDYGPKSDLVILKEICAFLKAKYDGTRMISGILYLHSIRDSTVGGSLRRSLAMFKKLCGPNPLENIVVVTTFWDELDLTQGIENETKLKTKYKVFKKLVDGKSRFARSGRYPTGKAPQGSEFSSPISIIADLLAPDPVFVELPNEPAEDITVHEALAGAELPYNELQELVADLNQKVAKMESINARDRAAMEALKDENEAFKVRFKEWEVKQHELFRDVAQLKKEKEDKQGEHDICRIKLQNGLELLKTLHVKGVLECQSKIRALLDSSSDDALQRSQLERTCENSKATASDLSQSLSQLRKAEGGEGLRRIGWKPTDERNQFHLGEIFRLYVFDDSPAFPRPFSRITAHPTCRICSHWRALATSDSRLWSSLCVIWPRMGHAHLVRLWLGNAVRSHPIPLSLPSQDLLSKDSTSAMRGILVLCITDPSRWLKLTLDPNGALQDMFHDLKEDSTARSDLDSFDVSLSDWSGSRRERLFKTEPHFPRHLRRKSQGCSYRKVLQTNVVWEQLSVLTLTYINNSEELFTILSRCSHLEVLDVDGILSDSVAPHSMITVSNLHELRLGHIRNIGLLLDNLILPQLNTVEFRHGFVEPTPPGWSSLCSLLSRSSCSLTRLTCGPGGYFALDDVISGLTSPTLSSLIELSLSIPITNPIVRSLTHNTTPDVPPPLPNLRHLVFTDCHTSDGFLSDFIYSRVSSPETIGPTLMSVKAQLLSDASNYPRDLQMAQAIQRSHGVSVKLFYPWQKHQVRSPSQQEALYEL